MSETSLGKVSRVDWQLLQLLQQLLEEAEEEKKRDAHKKASIGNK